MNLELKRTTKRKEATYGILSLNGEHLGYTVEQPWNDNTKGSSCVPDGTYQLFPWDSLKHGKVVVLCNPDLKVWINESDIPKGQVGRSTCLIHSANYANELRGCVAPGLDLMRDKNGVPIGVANSKVTVRALMAKLGDRKGHTLTISWL